MDYVTTTARKQMFCSDRFFSREGMASQNEAHAPVAIDNPVN